MDKNELLFFKEQARKDLLSFSVFTDQYFEIHNHHEIISDHLNKLLKGEIQNLMIEMPPRAWKSRLMQEFIAKIYWDTPKTDILYTWHSLNLLQWFSRNIRNRINSNEYKSLYNTQISSDSSAVNNWNIKNGWEFAIYWVWWGITWKWWNIMIIDDAYASRQDAESETIRRTVSDWYWSTFLSRKQNDQAKQIIIMQRWREDDLIWEILEREPEKWAELKIPALDENDNSFWPNRFNNDYFKDIRKQNPVFFSSQYQQDPVNKLWWDFKEEYFKFCEPIEIETRINRMDIVSFIDPAISQKQEADFTWLVTVWIDNTNNFVYLLEVKKLKETPDKIIEEAFDTARKYSIKWANYKMWIEVVQYQKMLALEIKNQMRIKDFYFHLEEVKPTWEKEARIRSILQPRYSSWVMIEPEHLNWWSELRLELLKFPNGKHDDLIDALASAISITEVNNLQKPNKIYSPNY